MKRIITVLLLTLTACVSHDAEEDQPCTLIGCANGPRCGPTCTNASVMVSGSPGAVSVYKSAGSVQCSGGGLTPAQMQIELTGAGIGVISAACGANGNGVIAMCGGPDGRINVFEVQAADVAAAQALGFALLTGLPNAVRIPC